MVGSSVRSVNARRLLHAAVLVSPHRAASARGLADLALAAAGEPQELHPLETLAAGWAAENGLADSGSALRRLAGRDLLGLLAAARRLEPSLAAWADPEAVLRDAAQALTLTLRAAGLPVPDVALSVVSRLPPPYDPPLLDLLSLDASDAAALGLAEGIVVRADRAVPFYTECCVGHALVHAALGAASPECLGRGFEEGLCEVLGFLHAGAARVGVERAEAAFAARRLTGALRPQREAFLDHVRGAALLHRRFGLVGLAALVSAGRPAVKRAELALAMGDPDCLALPAGTPDEALSQRLDRLLLARARPLVVSPLALLMADALRGGARTAADAARELGLAQDTALVAARELVGGPFVLVLSPDGRVLVDDLALVHAAGSLRYSVADSPGSAPGP